jgi:hypothetical protein
VVGYEEAIRETTGRRRVLLLGNGFSISASGAFGYPELHRTAVRSDPTLSKLFPNGETNFELALQKAAGTHDAARLRRALILAVANAHPATVLEFKDEKRRSCRDFLEPFVGRQLSPRGTVFTTNYDMLLHWVLSSQGKTPGTKQRTPIRCWDGFDSLGNWDGGLGADLHYLHGAVHIYEFPNEQIPARPYTRMLRYQRGSPLKKQVNALLEEGNFPAFVAEGGYEQKRSVQRDYSYLSRGRQAFQSACKDPAAVLFSMGHSFGPTDEHITKAVGAGTVTKIYIGTYSAQDVERAMELQETWSKARADSGRQTVSVQIFRSGECHVWDRYTPSSLGAGGRPTSAHCGLEQHG